MTRDGVGLAVRHWHSATATGSAVVLVHGFGGSKDSQALGDVATALTADGHHVISYTARGHRESEGMCTLGDLEHLDVEAAVDLARRDADRVVLVGASMGAIAVLRHASRGTPDGVVTVSSPSAWQLPRTVQGGAAALLTQTSVGRWIARGVMRVRLTEQWTDAAPPVVLARSVDAPLAIVHGRNDRFIKHGAANELYAASSGSRRIELVDRMGHAFVKESIPAIRGSVRWTLAVPSESRADT